MLCIIGFDCVLGGVMGAVFSVVFGVLSTLVNLTLDAVVGFDNLRQKLIFDFLKVAVLCYSLI